MIRTTILNEIVTKYKIKCVQEHRQPTYNGIGNELCITGATVGHIVRGTYKKGKPYTTKPHITRCICNDDFSIIRELFI